MVVQNCSSLGSGENREYLDFNLFHISGHDYAKVIFEENLKLVNDEDKVIDEVTISVEPGVLDRGGFEVFQYSQDEGLMLRTRSHVTSTLETNSEVRKMKQKETAKLLRITSLPSVYKFFLVETDLEQQTGSRVKTELKRSQCNPFVLEGANVLLLRKLALSRRIGEFKAHTVDNDGVFCEAHYKVEYLSPREVTVTRVVGSETMTTVMSVHGRIVHHRWSTSQWRLESGLPGSKLKVAHAEADGLEDGLGAKPEPEPLVDLPAYWQRKEEVIGLLKDYMVDHSDVQDMIADFMKNLLFEKPDDPIDFADKFLSEFLGITRRSTEVSTEIVETEKVETEKVETEEVEVEAGLEKSQPSLSSHSSFPDL